VADATRPDGTPAILKVLVPGTGNSASNEAAVLRLVGGDGCPVLYVHQLNALRNENDGGFRLIDPHGLLAEAEYDLGVLMRGDPVELLGGDPVGRARWLAARTGLDLVAIWEWGVVERLSTGLLLTRIRLQPLGRITLAAAEAVAGRMIG
jgi:hypothetical protein